MRANITHFVRLNCSVSIAAKCEPKMFILTDSRSIFDDVKDDTFSIFFYYINIYLKPVRIDIKRIFSIKTIFELAV